MVWTARLPARAAVEITGEDRVSFLQGLVSNDVATAASGRWVWAALLTPQGKWLADFFITAADGRLLLDMEAAQRDEVIARLARYRLRARAALAPVEMHVVASDAPPPATLPVVAAGPDPRHPAAGWRWMAEAPPAQDDGVAAWDAHRLRLGLPDGSRDLEREKTVLLEAGFDELGGIAWDKGCYMGQELTARTRYRGLVKRRLVPVTVEGPLPPPGTPVLRGGVEVGVLRSGLALPDATSALALLRLEALSGGALSCDGYPVTPRVPDWMRLPAAAGP